MADVPPDPATWFEAPTRFGPLRLCTAAAARHAADAAITLDRCDELLTALDDWTGLELAWQWTVAPVTRAATGLEAHARWQPAGDELPCWIESPWALLRSLPAPGDALASRLQWPSVPVVLSLARLHLLDDELRQLEPGGAVLLPQSMQSPWHGTLRTLGESGLGVPVALASPWRPRLLKLPMHAEAAPEVDAEGCLCEVRLAVSQTLPGSHLAGWLDGEVFAAGPQASLWRCASDDAPAHWMASGELIPWGDGWTLALRSVASNIVASVEEKV
jgi:hypothetical protein